MKRQNKMNGLINALQFLTILRIKKQPDMDTDKLGYSLLYFPLIGAFLGLVLIAVTKALSPFVPAGLLGLLLVFILIILSGAMHIDGLADSCDALFSSKGKEQMLSIMHEVHKGTFGVLSIIAIVLFKVELLSLVPAQYMVLSLLLLTVLSRYSMSLAIAFFPYARGSGKAKVFFEKKDIKILLFSTMITLSILAIIPRFINIIILFLVIIFTFSLSLFVNRRLGGLTGDILGALSELNELVVLLSVYVLSKTNF